MTDESIVLEKADSAWEFIKENTFWLGLGRIKGLGWRREKTKLI